MTTFLFLLLATTAGVIWWRIADTAPDDSQWGGGVPAGSVASTRLVHDERRQHAA